ncbi:conjugative transfer ATPase [Pseudomonas syringae]|nr:conjugative transfer ATPase [Pseudomonas syringae]MBS7460127.1 conjugative transfer ATPase [Pseudomonas syringae]MBS7470261.1 conjugative transfer ATPase [Pseudomonas syringae]NAO54996.1 conjugative transfer ATPase [Pseudomonas syringae]QVI71183.1 conjugative transfer ATPase [Pseudomonas syringae]
MREAPKTGHLTGETRKGGDALHALFDKLPEDTVLAITLVITPQDVLEAHLEKLARKSVGDNQASLLTREAVNDARKLIGREHKLYRGSIAFYLKGNDEAQLTARSMQLTNALLGAGMEPVASDDEVAPLNSYLRWLPGNFDVNQKRSMDWYVQMMLAQHVANLCPVWGRSSGTGHPGITLFNRGGAPLTFDPFNKLDRQMNAHMFLFGPTGAGKSATLNNLLNQLIAVYAPRLFIVEAGNSFGLLGDFAKKLGLTVNRIKLAPNSGVSLAPFADAIRLVNTPSQVKTLDADDLESSDEHINAKADEDNDERDVLGEMEIVARLMITGGEEKEEARLTRADRSVIRHCILAAARVCSDADRTVLTEDVRNALRTAGEDTSIPEGRRNRMLEMAEAMDMFCMGADGEMFNRTGTPWPEADLTIVDLATYAREGYNAQLSIAYISLINTVNNIAERDQYKGRPLVNVTDQLFNVNRFSGHYRRNEMNSNQVEAMYKKLTAMTGIRMTPHRFRHTIASELMTLPERNIYLTKKLLNHSNIATTMDYIEPDYDMMREVMNERGKRPAKISYMAKPDATLRADRHRSISAPVKDLTASTKTRETTAEAESSAGQALARPRALPTPISTMCPSTAPDTRTANRDETPSPTSDRDTAVSQLPLGCSSPEDLLRSLGELTRWVQNNIAGGGTGAEPVIEERPVPSQDARHLRPEMLELAGWIGRSG